MANCASKQWLGNQEALSGKQPDIHNHKKWLRINEGLSPKAREEEKAEDLLVQYLLTNNKEK